MSAAAPREPAAGSTSSSTATVGVGLLVFGLAGFVFLGLVGRDLGPAGAAPVSVAWTILNALGIGLFAPLEQDVGRRISAALARGPGTSPDLTRVRRYAWASVVTVALVGVLGADPIADLLLSGDTEFVYPLVLALAAMALAYWARGVLAGTGRFRRYSAQLAIDGGLRIGLTAVLFAMPVSSAVAYLGVLAVAPAAATLCTIPLRELVGRAAPRADSAGAYSLGPLVLTNLSAQLLANAGPLAIAAIASPAEQATTGHFVAAVTIARIPLFLFGAVQAVFLPSLAAHVPAHRHAEFRAALRRGLLITAGLGAAGVLGVALLGRWIMRVIYGPAFQIAVLDITLIAVSGALFMVAQLLVQGLLAHRADAVVALGWALGIAVTALTLLVPLATTTTVALALCTGSAASLVCHGLALRRATAAWAARPGASVPHPES